MVACVVLAETSSGFAQSGFLSSIVGVGMKELEGEAFMEGGLPHHMKETFNVGPNFPACRCLDQPTSLACLFS